MGRCRTFHSGSSPSLSNTGRPQLPREQLSHILPYYLAGKVREPQVGTVGQLGFLDLINPNPFILRNKVLTRSNFMWLR